MISYKPLFHTMIDKNITKKDLKDATGITWNTISKLSKDENVSLSVVDKICDYLNCDIQDVIKHYNN